ncbi:glycoside hydrolase family 97 protein [Pedobacter africanus]|uniref:Alpha-glucosidase n=1 Tax=Pedobacter africanus TaxID=151894 RepID=A0A1W1YPH0_9SPHI|nr:glycoside hydrolase family 97 protein [Pedobacter africanus]SMC38012.1 alpha-glucosidase [Pedobacter africanus]
MVRINYLLLLLLLVAAKASSQTNIVVKSPNQKISFNLSVQKNKLSYFISGNNIKVIEPSAISMALDLATITEGVTLGKAEVYELNEQYPWYGAHSTARNHYKGAKIPVSKGSLNYFLDVRVFNDGAAFRLIVPGKEQQKRIADEATVFTLPKGTAAWYHDLYMHYEGVYEKRLLDTVKAGQWAAPSVTFQLPGSKLYVAITEADLKNYGGMALQSNGRRGMVLRLPQNQPTSYPYKLRYSPEDTLKRSKPAAITGTIHTPWRVIMIAENLNSLVNNDMVHNLCPPPDKQLFPEGIKTAWIKPGPAVWKYLDDGGESSVANMKEFSRMAAELGFKHNILEGFWRRWSDNELQDLVNYSKEKGVGIWLWEHSKDLWDAGKRQAFFKKCHDMGIAGLKLDFFDHEGKDVVDLYQDILKETAALQLMLDFHGANKPTGTERTWPNELTREAVKGMEASKLADRAGHNVTLPFTRFIAGHAEYTPVHFGERRKNTTWAHQIATAAIFSAPLLTYAASPQNLLNNPAVEMIKSIPSIWDETIVLPGSAIGEAAVYARRKGDTWFLAVINGSKPKKLNIPLSFLVRDAYQTLEVKDTQGNTGALTLENKTYGKADSIELELGEGGGYIARFGL